MVEKQKYLKGKRGQKKRVAPALPFKNGFALEVPNPEFGLLSLQIPPDGTFRSLYSCDYMAGLPVVDHTPKPYEQILESEKSSKDFDWYAFKHIYVFVGQLSGLIKVGYSKHAERRLIQSQSGSGETILEFALLDGDRKIERLIHEQLKPFRHHGEWYYPTEQVLTWLDEAEAYGGY